MISWNNVQLYQLVFLVDFEENPVKSNRACSRSLHSLSMIFDKFKGCSDKRHCRLPYRTITMVHWCVQNLSTPALILKSIHQIRLLIELIELGSSLFFFFYFLSCCVTRRNVFARRIDEANI